MERMNVEKARELRCRSTDAEQLLWRHLRHLRHRQLDGCKFRRQHEVDRYIVDFVCADAMLIVELDGGQHADQASHDNRRTRRLQAIGYHVLRFWNNDVLTNIESVLEVILNDLASPAPHPNPLPHLPSGMGERALSSQGSEE